MRQLFLEAVPLWDNVRWDEVFCQKCPNTELFLRNIFYILTEYRKIRTRNNSVIGHFSRSGIGLQLDRKLLFNKHANNKIWNGTKGIGLLLKLQPILPRRSLVNIYQSFIRPHLEYSNVIHDQPSNESF